MPAVDRFATNAAGPAPAAPSTTPGWAELPAPQAWRTVDFISDLHLQASEPETFQAWQHYIENTAAQAVFILGDLFEVWVGDDAVGQPAAGAAPDAGFEQRCREVLTRAASQRDIFFMCGNRDFLVGERFARDCGLSLLGDPAILGFAGQRWLLSHGDALCLADTDYMRFRMMVRTPAWRDAFLAQPLKQRLATARALRSRSEAHKRTHPALVDLDAQAITIWLRAAQATSLIHGHTHRPADHDLGHGRQRVVLSDWDLHATPARAQVLRLGQDTDTGTARLRRLSPGAACDTRGA